MWVRTCQERKVSYGYAVKSAVWNQTKIKKNLDELNEANKVSTSRKEVKIGKVADETSTSSQSVLKSSKESSGASTSSQNISTSRKVQAVSPDVSEVISAVTDVLNSYASYLTALSYAITTVEVISQNNTMSMCGVCVDVFMANSYFKTVCRAVLEPGNFLAAIDLCPPRGLKLMQVTSSDDFNALLQGAYGLWGTAMNDISVHVGGYLASNGVWMFGNKKAYSGITVTAVNGRYLQCHLKGVTGTFWGSLPSYISTSLVEFTKVQPPRMIPKASGCRNTTDISDSASNYRKSACIASFLSWPNGDVARSLCLSLGMNVFGIKTAEDYQALKTFTLAVFGNVQNFFVEGGEVNGVWMVGNELLYSGAVPTSVTGPCLIFRTNETAALPCGGNFRPLCEYDKNVV